MKKKGCTTQPARPTTTGPAPAAGTAQKPSRAAISRHQRKCTVCQHPQREQIEQEFLQWRSPQTIAEFYKLTERAVYRHAHALDLYQRRSTNLRFSLGHIIEQVERIHVTPESIIDAVRIFAHLSSDGRWVNPPRRVIIEHVGEEAPASPRVQHPSRKRASRSSRSKLSRSNRQSPPSNSPCNSLKTTDRAAV